MPDVVVIATARARAGREEELARVLREAATRTQGAHFKQLSNTMSTIISGPPQTLWDEIIDEAAVIRHSVQIAASREAIYPLVSTAGGFRRWWAADVTEAGGAVELGFFNRATVYRLRKTRDSRPTEAEWRCETGQEWTGTRIRFHLEAREPGTLLHFTHADWQTASDYFVSCNTTWGELMYRIKATAEGHVPGPLFSTSGMADQ